MAIEVDSAESYDVSTLSVPLSSMRNNLNVQQSDRKGNMERICA